MGYKKSFYWMEFYTASYHMVVDVSASTAYILMPSPKEREVFESGLKLAIEGGI